MVSWATASKTRLGKEGYYGTAEEGEGEGDGGKEEGGTGDLVSEEMDLSAKEE